MLIPSADRPADNYSPLPDFVEAWSDTHLLSRLPALSCWEAESLAALLGSEESHASADAVRRTHIEAREQACLVDHNTGEPII